MIDSMRYRALGLVVTFSVAALPAFAGPVFYIQQNLVSDIPGLAPVTDPNLVNPWGLSDSATSPWWVSDNGTGLATLYNGNTGAASSLVVTIPPPAGGMPPSAPDGQVFNSTASSFVINGGTKASFIFATEDGTISAWNGVQGTNALLEVDNSASGAVYKGLALGSAGGNNYLYAANFNSGNIDVFNGSFAPTTVAGSFTDPNLPAGYAPFNIENIGGLLYVTYAKQDGAKHDDVAGAGNGYVDVFDTSGNFLQRLASNGALNSPWGLALAPSDFGVYSGDLLIGNFGDGTIDVFSPTLSGDFLGTLDDSNGDPITIPGLWGLEFGNGASAGPVDDLYFTAGIPGPGGMVEDNGLFGDIVASPEPATSSITAMGLALILLAAYLVRARVPRSNGARFVSSILR
jgi:uncharacterized protein (TIGR03118 family)